MGQKTPQVICIQGLHPGLVLKPTHFTPCDGDKRFFVIRGAGLDVGTGLAIVVMFFAFAVGSF